MFSSEKMRNCFSEDSLYSTAGTCYGPDAQAFSAFASHIAHHRITLLNGLLVLLLVCAG